MMETKQRILDCIFQAIDEVNARLPDEQQIEKSIDAVWVGPLSSLDSLALTFFIVAMEKRIRDQFGIALVIASQSINSHERSPMRSAPALIEYIFYLLEKNREGKKC